MTHHSRRVLVSLAAGIILAACTNGAPSAEKAGGPTTGASAASTAASTSTTSIASGAASKLPSSGLLLPGVYRSEVVQGIRVTFPIVRVGWFVQSVNRLQFALEVGQPRDYNNLRAIDVVVPDLVPQPACASLKQQRFVPAPADFATWLYHNPCFVPLGATHPVTIAGMQGLEWQARTKTATVRLSGNGFTVPLVAISKLRQRAGEPAASEYLVLGHLQQFDMIKVGGRQVLLIIEAPAADFAALRKNAQQVFEGMRIEAR